MLARRFEEALVLAHRLHAGQVRRVWRTPFLSHPLAVASVVLEHGGDETAGIAALLHDAPEEGEGEETLSTIAACFGEAVALVVRGCSDPGTFQQRKAPWRERKAEFLRGLRTAPERVRLVAASDKCVNCSGLVSELRWGGLSVLSRFNAPDPSSICWYYREAAEALCTEPGLDERLACELERGVLELLALLGSL